MRESSKILLDQYQVRKSKKEKQEFIQWLDGYLKDFGYELKQEEYKSGINLVVGDVEGADITLTAHYDTQPNFFIPIFMGVSNYFSFIISNLWMLVVLYLPVFLLTYLGFKVTNSYVIAYFVFMISLILVLVQKLVGVANKHTANDNTSGVATLLAILEDLQSEKREKVAFVFFDQEEVGLVGSMNFKSKYKHIISDKPLINFDCVSDGDNLMFVEKKAFRESTIATDLNNAMNSTELTNDKKFLVRNAATTIYTSDQIIFKNSAAVGAFHKLPIFG